MKLINCQDEKVLNRWDMDIIDRSSRVRSDDDQEFVFERAVINTKSGANVLPYLLLNGKWHVVLVQQFRVSINRTTLEAPGGAIDYDGFEHLSGEEQKIKVVDTMARELSEETGIVVKPSSVILLFKEYILPPLLSAFAWGGAVRIRAEDLPDVRQKIDKYEVTYVKVLELKQVLRFKNYLTLNGFCFDLWTSRLIDEVVRLVGFNGWVS